LERRWLFVVAVDIAQQAGQFVERRGIESAMLLQTIFRAFARALS
jgi:hypothetical protein